MNYNETIFSDFAKFSEAGFAAEHPVILLQSPEQKMVLEMSSVDIVNGYEKSKRTDFEDTDSLRPWYEERFASAVVRVKNNPDAPQLFTFVTCSYNHFASERTLVYAQPLQERITYESNTD